MTHSAFQGTPLILVVEDEPINREILVETLKESGYATVTAATGAAAWEQITQYEGRLDAILLDRLLPDMDTLDMLEKHKNDSALAHVPVIIQTSMSDEKDIADGLKAGAYYYLIKPIPPDTLLAIVRSAVSERRDYLQLQRSLRQTHTILKRLESAEFSFTTQMEARDLATLTAHIAPDPEKVVLGLTELMLNAVEHGNLAITYEEKSKLIAANNLEGEIERRLSLSEYGSRKARLKVLNNHKQLQYVICDEGKGFNWEPFLEMSPARAFDTHGRGIAMSRLLSFDSVDYQGCGNQVIATIRH